MILLGELRIGLQCVYNGLCKLRGLVFIYVFVGWARIWVGGFLATRLCWGGLGSFCICCVELSPTSKSYIYALSFPISTRPLCADLMAKDSSWNISSSRKLRSHHVRGCSPLMMYKKFAFHACHHSLDSRVQLPTPYLISYGFPSITHWIIVGLMVCWLVPLTMVHIGHFSLDPHSPLRMIYHDVSQCDQISRRHSTSLAIFHMKMRPLLVHRRKT